MKAKSWAIVGFTSVVTLGSLVASVASANPRGGFQRGAGEASWDSRFDWNPGATGGGGSWRGGREASWDSRFDNRSGSSSRRGGFQRGAGEASWDSRFDWNR